MQGIRLAAQHGNARSTVHDWLILVPDIEASRTVANIADEVGTLRTFAHR